MKKVIHLFLLMISINGFTQKPYISKVWVADNGDGTYKNPILHADYSDPDAIRVGENYYLVSSSFEDIPGLPILQSRDLVNWKIIGHALNRQPPFEHFSATRHGEGVWAPSIRYYFGKYYLYYPDPDFGIYLTTALNPAGPWTSPVLVEEGKGLIDPCPLLDSDGQLYLVHAFAGSRAGIKSVLVVKKLNATGTKTIDHGVLVYDGHEKDPTLEGPKFYKRNGYYYIFAPAGGVQTGWQLVLRSKNVYGPYERRVVMDQGNSPINGPHQGAWVTTQKGESWFLHFQDKDAYGRILHLQPMQWINDWPIIGIDKDGDGKGEPVLEYKKPSVGKIYTVETPAETDEFEGTSLGLQWQFMANTKGTWYYLNSSKGCLRLYSQKIPDEAKNLWDVPNVLLQKFPSDEFKVTTKMTFAPNKQVENEKAGLTIMGMSYAGLALKHKKDGDYLVSFRCKDAALGKGEIEQQLMKVSEATIYLRVTVKQGGKCTFYYSTDGNKFDLAGDEFVAEAGRWIGAKVGIFCTRSVQINDSGWADFDWFKIDPIDPL